MTESEAEATLKALDALKDGAEDAICYAEPDGQQGWAVRIEHDGYVYRVVADFRAIERRERLAALAHEQWAGWMRYLFGQSVEDEDGQVIIPPGLVERWQRQVATAYEDLPEQEKQSDRDEADRVLALLDVAHLAAGKD